MSRRSRRSPICVVVPNDALGLFGCAMLSRVDIDGIPVEQCSVCGYIWKLTSGGRFEAHGRNGSLYGVPSCGGSGKTPDDAYATETHYWTD
ncbi:hypothetical protein M2284_005277 [Rhodococcus sp. LBL1]|nr:hypothetical protein [Rhodococcus sp. LBL1]MDH6686340.1 hypothetical protein [Rhodococcus sp. LBL2]